MIERGLSHIPQPTQGPEQAVTHQAHKKSFGPTTPFSPEQRKLEPAKRTSESPFVLHVTEAVEDVPFAFAKRKGEDDKPNSVAHFYTIQENGKDGRKLHVMVVEYGLDKPADQNKPDEPILIRIDHACTCMRHPIYGHDCNQQREIGEQTMREMGRGMMVYVDTDTVESMGHGPGVLWRHQKRLMEAQQAGEQGPSMLDHFKEEGITDPDRRPHREIAAIIAKRLEERGIDENQTPLLLMGSSPAKIDSLENGHKIPVHPLRVIVADRKDRSKAKLGYGEDEDVKKSGVYAEVPTSDGKMRLVPLTHTLFRRYKELVIDPKQEREKEQWNVHTLPVDWRQEQNRWPQVKAA